MSISVEMHETAGAGNVHGSATLNEGVWQAWLDKGRAEEIHDAEMRMKVVKWSSITGLAVATGFYSQLPPYAIVLRFLVMMGSIAVLLQCLKVRQYGFAAVFGALVLLYNPLAPGFNFSGDWQRAAVAATAVPFAASLVWRNRSSNQNV